MIQWKLKGILINDNTTMTMAKNHAQVHRAIIYVSTKVALEFSLASQARKRTLVPLTKPHRSEADVSILVLDVACTSMEATMSKELS